MTMNTLWNTRKMTQPRSVVPKIPTVPNVNNVTQKTTPIRNKDYKGMIIMTESLTVGRLLRMTIKIILILTQILLIASIYLLKVLLTGQSPTQNSCRTLDLFMIMLFILDFKILLSGGGMGTVWR